MCSRGVTKNREKGLGEDGKNRDDMRTTRNCEDEALHPWSFHKSLFSSVIPLCVQRKMWDSRIKVNESEAGKKTKEITGNADGKERLSCFFWVKHCSVRSWSLKHVSAMCLHIIPCSFICPSLSSFSPPFLLPKHPYFHPPCCCQRKLLVQWRIQEQVRLEKTIDLCILSSIWDTVLLGKRNHKGDLFINSTVSPRQQWD